MTTGSAKPDEAKQAEDERVPAFARDFPDDAGLRALVRAFADGDYARVRREAPKLAEASGDPAVKRAALVLVERLRPDPLALLLLGVTAALLVLLTAFWVAHRHAPPPPAAPPHPVPTVEHVR